MLRFEFGVLIFLGLICTQSFAQDAILHRQNVRRDDVAIGQGLKGTKGVLMLGQDSIEFSALNRNNKVIDFKLSYAQIFKVKRYRAILLPNRIGIKTSDDGTYRIFTYKRKKILKVLEERLMSS